MLTDSAPPAAMIIDERRYQTTLAYLEHDLDGFIGGAFADTPTAAIKVSHCVMPAFALAGWVGAGAEMLRSQFHARAALRGTAPEDIIVTLGDQIHVVRLVSPEIFLFVAVSRKASNLALVNLAIKARTVHLYG